MRLKNLDLFKGVLIVLVIIGHILRGSRNNSIWLAIIYSFHMPLFIGVSGFLFNANKVASYNLVDLLRKYSLRIVLPWSIAVICYFPFLGHHSNTLTGLFNAFIFPSYHLWFIPGFLSWVILTWFLKQIKLGNGMLLTIGLIMTVIPVALKKYPEIYQDLGILNSVVNSLLDTFKPHYYFFFLFGLVFRDLKLKRPKIMEYVVPSISLVLVIYYFYNPNIILSTFNLFLLNTLLLSLVLKVSTNNMVRENRTIEWIGLNSLAIYLWHVFPILICKYAIGTKNLALFYSATIALELIFIFTYKYLVRVPFLKKYVFGM